MIYPTADPALTCKYVWREGAHPCSMSGSIVFSVLFVKIDMNNNSHNTKNVIYSSINLIIFILQHFYVQNWDLFCEFSMFFSLCHFWLLLQVLFVRISEKKIIPPHTHNQRFLNYFFCSFPTFHSCPDSSGNPAGALWFSNWIEIVHLSISSFQFAGHAKNL